VLGEAPGAVKEEVAVRSTRISRQSVVGGLLVAAAMLIVPDWVANARAVVFTVSGTGDNTTACTGGACPTLRSAVLASNAAGGTNTINVPAGQFTLTRTPSGPDDGTTGDLHITANVTIAGVGARPGGTTIVGDGDRIFDISAGAVTLSGMTLTGGSGQVAGGAIEDTGAALILQQDALTKNTTAPGGSGGAIDLAPLGPGSLTVQNSVFGSNTAAETGPTGGGFGGAISFEPGTSGHVTVTRSEFDSNTAQSGTTSGGGFGGAISFEPGDAGTLTISGSTFSANVAAGSTSQGGFGGAISFEPGSGASTLTVTNSTITGNHAGGSSSFGGALDWEPGTGSSGTLTQATITANTASTSGQGGGLSISGAPLTIRNSIISGNTGGGVADNCSVDVSANLLPQGHNIEQGTTCGFDINANPLLAGLARNGGPTRTMALAPNSPARDAADPAFCPPTDQRGIARPDDPGTACDIGAYEFVIRVPVNLSRPVITGKPVIGRTVTCSNGRWTNNPTKFSYRWSRGGVPIRGATRRTVTVPALDRDDTVTGRGDQDDLLTCTVVASNAAGSSKPATSLAVTPHQAP
jgi:hypothetical protein